MELTAGNECMVLLGHYLPLGHLYLYKLNCGFVNYLNYGYNCTDSTAGQRSRRGVCDVGVDDKLGGRAGAV